MFDLGWSNGFSSGLGRDPDKLIPYALISLIRHCSIEVGHFSFI